jgi:glucosamine--fructose-6-phosphate aminotransferase (isomerizing)
MALFGELQQQPEYLRRLVDFYQSNANLLDLRRRFPGRQLVFTGMGASVHTAWISSYYLSHLGMPCTAVDATDLLNYGMGMPGPDSVLVYISQSGSSGEVPALLDRLGPDVPVVAITNHTDSTLATRADVTLPMVAGKEGLVASRTYINTLAILWWVARSMVGKLDDAEFDTVLDIAERIAVQLENAEAIRVRLLDTFEQCQPLLFLGHGPHGVTARQAAMILSEWSKLAALHFNIGAFRHGYIEIVEPGCGVVVFAPPGQGVESARALAGDLQGYGAKVLLVENGRLRGVDEPIVPGVPLDEFLSPIVDIVPFQIYTDALAPRRGFGKGFRYINKVVTQL